MENNELKHLLIAYKSTVTSLQETHDEILSLFGVVVPFVCHNCQGKEYKELTRSTSQCKKCDHLQAN